jgi:hypothetical protein
LVVTGGIGAANNSYIGGTLTVTGSLSTAGMTSSAAVYTNILSGTSTNDVLINGSITCKQGNNASSSTSTGSLVVNGGIGAANNSYIGGSLTAYSGLVSNTLAPLSGTSLTVNISSTAAVTVNGAGAQGTSSGGTLVVNGGLSTNNNSYIGGTLTTSNTIYANSYNGVSNADVLINSYVTCKKSTTAGTTSTSGTLVVAGGLSTSLASYVGGGLTVGGSVTNAGMTSSATVSISSGSLQVNSWNPYSGTSLTLNSSAVTVNSSNSVGGAGTGTLVVSGGLSTSAASYIGGALTVNGSVAATGFSATSDYRLKENVKDLAFSDDDSEDTSGVNPFDRLRPVSFVKISDQRGDMGFLAHEVQEIFPELVYGKKDDPDEFQTLNYIGLIAALVHEVQSLKKRMKALET